MKDTDGDGIPDDWERKHKLNLTDSSDGNLINNNGYSNLEEYLNSSVTSFSVLPLMQTGGQKMPMEWIDKDTHHKVIRLTQREGNSVSFYFHNNPFISGQANDGDRMVFYGNDIYQADGVGMQLFTVNLSNLKIEIPATRRPGKGFEVKLKGCRGNNLKNIDVSFPLGKLIVVTGVSGSGKSSLINETLQPALSHFFYRSNKDPLPFDSIEGVEHIDKIISVDQSPLGRTPRSNPATYTGVFSDIRNLFVNLPEARIRGYKPGRFSFNVAGGRCETCNGNGYKTIEMNFLPDVLVPCEDCQGKHYNRETLEVRFKGKSIADVLDMTINVAVEFFENQPQILHKIKTLQDVGLGYIKLGQPSTTLSGGENQRVKLAAELAKKDTGKTLYVLDEPTTGLHFDDIRVLMGVLNRIVNKGNTVIVIEHNMDVIKLADHIIDIGPEGGRLGGRLLFNGTPEELAKNPDSWTAHFLKRELYPD